jgi:acyl-CoA thioester hydrolase
MLQNQTSFVFVGERPMGIVNTPFIPVGSKWRTELFCELKLPYGEMEKKGVMLSVADSVITFHSPPITKIANHYHVY